MCWIDGGSFITCGYRIPRIPLGRNCNCRRFSASPLVRVVEFNYRFSHHYISFMWHRLTIASQPIFVFCMFSMCSLRRSRKHLRFHPIIVVQTSTFIYICITWRREAVHSLNTSLPFTSRLWSLSKAYILSPQNSKFKWWLLWFWLSSSSKSSSTRPIYVGVLGATTFGTYTSLLWSNTDFFLLLCYLPWLKKLL